MADSRSNAEKMELAKRKFEQLRHTAVNYVYGKEVNFEQFLVLHKALHDAQDELISLLMGECAQETQETADSRNITHVSEGEDRIASV